MLWVVTTGPEPQLDIQEIVSTEGKITLSWVSNQCCLYYASSLSSSRQKRLNDWER